MLATTAATTADWQSFSVFPAAKDRFYFVFFQPLVVNTPGTFTSALTSFELTF